MEYNMNEFYSDEFLESAKYTQEMDNHYTKDDIYKEIENQKDLLEDILINYKIAYSRLKNSENNLEKPVYVDLYGIKKLNHQISIRQRALQFWGYKLEKQSKKLTDIIKML